MDLEFRPDAAAVQAYWDRFWRGESRERPALLASVPKSGRTVPPWPHIYNLPRRPLGPQIDALLAWAEAQEFLGDLLPGYQISFAAEHFALLLGAEMRYSAKAGRDAETGWILPCLDDYATPIRFRPDCRWWETTVAITRAFRARADGRLIIYWSELSGGLDALAALRGPERLVLDLIERPDDVKRALAQLDQAHDDVRAALAAELDIPRWGSLTRHGMYARGWTSVPQCDFSCMISAPMFREFGIASLVRECALLDGASYHLDGPGAIRHLEALAEVPRLRLIQWQPGAGNAATADWTALYDHIGRLGLGLWRVGHRRDLLDCWRRSTSPYMCFHVTDVKTRAEFEAFQAEVACTQRG